jgi:sugar/nucleoside kinase (ribokinase family)
MNDKPISISSCDVLMFGDYFCDLIITGLKEIPRLGADLFGEAMDVTPGGAYIMAVALHRLGVKVRWAARLGTDIFSRFIDEEARREGLDTSLFEHLDQPYRSMSLSFSFAQDRGFISHTDPAPAGISQYSVIASQKPRWVINGPFDGSKESCHFPIFVHENGGKVYTDCQYTTLTLSDEGLSDLLSNTDIFAPNLSEARQLTGASNAEAAAGILALYVPLVLVKCGPDGAIAQSGKQVWHAPAINVKVIDTTGAGDCFNAGFLAAHLAGEPIESCLRYGNICGGLSVTRCGGASAAPTLEQLKSFLH